TAKCWLREAKAQRAFSAAPSCTTRLPERGPSPAAWPKPAKATLRRCSRMVRCGLSEDPPLSLLAFPAPNSITRPRADGQPPVVWRKAVVAIPRHCLQMAECWSRQGVVNPGLTEIHWPARSFTTPLRVPGKPPDPADDQDLTIREQRRRMALAGVGP